MVSSRVQANTDPDGEYFLAQLTAAIANAPDEGSRERITAYKKAVTANYAGYPVGDGSEYHDLTESDCIVIWGEVSGRADGTPRKP